jgi:hypothetical protein
MKINCMQCADMGFITEQQPGTNVFYKLKCDCKDEKFYEDEKARAKLEFELLVAEARKQLVLENMQEGTAV